MANQVGSIHAEGQARVHVGNINCGLNSKCLADLGVTDPRYHKARIVDTKGGLLKDSYRWILDNADFRKWRHDENSRLLWIKGDPGKGKTMLLCGIIDELQKEMEERKKLTYEESDTGPTLLSFFFCQATDSLIDNATAILRGLTYLLVLQQRTLISYVRKKYDDEAKGKTLFEGTTAWFALSEIFSSILQDPSLKTAYLVIDALDECTHDLPRLLKFIVEMSSTSRHVKWIVSSRNLPQIEEQLAMAAQNTRLSLELNAESVAVAVDAYIRHKVLDLSRQKQYSSKMKRAVQAYLSSNANGTFLWVALVCQALADPEVLMLDTITKLRSFPAGLDSLYARMMKQVHSSNYADHCKQILAIITVLHRPISLRELTALLEIPDNISDDLDSILAEIQDDISNDVESTLIGISDDILDNLKSLEEFIRICGSFLTLREQTVYFVHQSAKDFLLGRPDNEGSRKAFNWVFPHGMEHVNYIIFSRSLNAMSMVLRRDIYDLRAPGFSIDKVQTPSSDPLATVRYSCIYWVDHLCDSQSSDNNKHPDVLQDSGVIDNFLRRHYLYWLEALSLCRSVSQGIFSMAKLESILQQKAITSQLPSLVNDMRRFILSCRWVVENYPLQLYASALVFSPARSITRELFKQEERKWITSGPIVEDSWNACQQTLEGHSNPVNSVAFSPDSKLIASGSNDDTIKIWDATTGAYKQTLEGHSNPVISVAFSPDSKLIASGSNDNTIKIWDATTGACKQTLEGHSNWVRSVAFSPDSKLIASGSNDMTIKIWDATTGACKQTLEGHSHWVRSVAFSPDSKLIASGSNDMTIKIWDATTGTHKQTLEGHSNWVRLVAFSPDSKLIASGSNDMTIKIWDATTGACKQTLEGHYSSVHSLASSLNSKLIESGSDDANPPYYRGYSRSSDNRWIKRGSENWLWLPPEYRPNCSAGAASKIAIGCTSGRVLITIFPTDNE